MEAIGKKFWNTAPIYTAAWNLGGYKAKGVGLSETDSLAIATSTSPDFALMHFKMDIKENYLRGQFYTVNKVIGIYALKKGQ